MFIKNNPIANQLYVSYTKNIRDVSQSARRLATGDKVPTAADGAGELGLAERLAIRWKGMDKLTEGMASIGAFIQAQDDTIGQVIETIDRMVELAAAALDPTKTTADRAALDSEFKGLVREMSFMKGRKFNGVSLFGKVLSMRYGIEATNENMTLSIIGISFTTAAYSLISVTTASLALSKLKIKLGSVNKLRALVGQHANAVTRTVDFVRSNVNSLKDAENQIRSVDLAKETGTFTQKQVILSASQSVLAQANGLIQTALTFIG